MYKRNFILTEEKKLIKKYLVLFLILSFIGHFISFYFYEVSLNQIKHVERINFYNNWVPINFLFSVSIGILPLFYLVYLKISIKTSIIQVIILYIISLVTGFIFWLIRIKRINKYFEFNSKKNIDFDNLYLELFWIIGLISGFVIYIGIFKYLNSKNRTL